MAKKICDCVEWVNLDEPNNITNVEWMKKKKTFNVCPWCGKSFITVDESVNDILIDLLN